MGMLAPEESPALLNPLLARQVARYRQANERPLAVDDLLSGGIAGVKRWPGQVRDDLEQLGQWLAQKQLGEQNISNVLDPDYRAMHMPTARGSVGPSPSKQFEFGRGVAELLNPAYLTPTGAEGPAMAIFAGMKGATPAKRAALDVAKRMDAEGASREDIWNRSGWFKGPDKQWRWEIDDSEAKLKPEYVGVSGGEYSSVASVLDHPELFAQYPALKNISANLSFEGTPGSITGGLVGSRHINLTTGGPELGTREGLLHELQHAVQGQEGFALGGNPEMFHPHLARYDEVSEALNAVDGIKEIRANLNKPDYMPTDQEIKDWARATWGAEIKPSAIELAKTTPRDALQREFENYYDLFKELPNGVAMGAQMTAKRAYNRLAGEREAYGVMGRSQLTPEERMQNLPWRSYGNPDNMLLRHGNEVSPISPDAPQIWHMPKSALRPR